MNWKKYVAASAAACAAVFAAAAWSPVSASAAAAAASAAPAAAAAQTAPAGATQVKSTAYRYTSGTYGYSITCPTKPVGVVPMSMFYEGEKGDVIIFENDGYALKKAWLVVPDAYSDKDIPDLRKLTEAQTKELIKRFTEKGGCEFVRIAEMNDNRGLYTVTAKEIEIDTDGDGKPDTTAKSDNQMVKTYFKGEYGGNFMVGLINNPDLTREAVAEYEAGLLSFQQWPTTAANGSTQNAKNTKNSKKKK